MFAPFFSSRPGFSSNARPATKLGRATDQSQDHGGGQGKQRSRGGGDGGARPGSMTAGARHPAAQPPSRSDTSTVATKVLDDGESATRRLSRGRGCGEQGTDGERAPAGVSAEAQAR